MVHLLSLMEEQTYQMQMLAALCMIMLTSLLLVSAGSLALPLLLLIVLLAGGWWLAGEHLRESFVRGLYLRREKRRGVQVLTQVQSLDITRPTSAQVRGMGCKAVDGGTGRGSGCLMQLVPVVQDSNNAFTTACSD